MEVGREEAVRRQRSQSVKLHRQVPCRHERSDEGHSSNKVFREVWGHLYSRDPEPYHPPVVRDRTHTEYWEGRDGYDGPGDRSMDRGKNHRRASIRRTSRRSTDPCIRNVYASRSEVLGRRTSLKVHSSPVSVRTVEG